MTLNERTYYVYLLASRRNGTPYVGVTNNLPRRVWEYKEGSIDGFTKQSGVKLLVYYETYLDVRDAIQREKNIKKWPRGWKLDLIRSMNPDWRDFYEDFARGSVSWIAVPGSALRAVQALKGHQARQ